MTLHGVGAVVVVCALLAAWVVLLIARGRLYVGYGVVWLTVLGGAVLIVAFPPLTRLVTALSGAANPASGLALFAFVFIALVLIYYSVQLSILSTRVNRVAQELGTLLMDLRESRADDD